MDLWSPLVDEFRDKEGERQGELQSLNQKSLPSRYYRNVPLNSPYQA